MKRSVVGVCKKRKTDVVPLDLLIEILKRLPEKSVVRFLLVSKSWAEIIRSKSFIRCFPHRPLTQPLRFLFTSNEKHVNGTLNISFFSSSSLSSSSTTLSTSFLSRVTIPSRLSYNSRSFVNGLMNIGQIICNPCTGKYVILPRVKCRNQGLVIRFFGYDPVDNHYKVMCMLRNLEKPQSQYEDFRVFTLGEKPKSWRLIDCSIPHTPYSNGLCIGGFVYYIAHTDTEMCLMRFDLKSEKFDIFASVSEDLRALWFSSTSSKTLINYHGKVAITVQPFHQLPLIDLFVFEAGKQDFKEMSFHNLPHLHLSMKGITHTGEIIFAPKFSRNVTYNVIRHDLKRASFEDIKIQVDDENPDHLFPTSFYSAGMGYVESLMLL